MSEKTSILTKAREKVKETAKTTTMNLFDFGIGYAIVALLNFILLKNSTGKVFGKGFLLIAVACIVIHFIKKNKNGKEN